MFAQVNGLTTCGIDGVMILVEVDISNGLPNFDLVGLPAMAVRESKERVKAAMRNSDYPFPMTKITVNLAPADLRKEGSGLDLPIAIGLLTCSRLIDPTNLDDKVFVGELSLDGRIRKVSGVLSMVMEAKRFGAKEIYIPKENAAEGKLIQGIKVYTASSLQEIVEHLTGKQLLEPLPKENILQNKQRIYHVDFADIKGQLVARRALEIAAAGGHSIMMIGSPGCGKTMLARRLVTILPPMTESEALEVTKIYSIVGMLPQADSVMLERPFRSPHHSISGSALLGGGSTPRPGEVTLSHNGVLFLDELPEFDRSTLEMLRQPLEDGEVSISRVRAAMTFPSRFILVAAQNPCPCAYTSGNSDSLAFKIRSLRIAKGYTIKGLAERSGLSFATISALESGQPVYKLSTLASISHALDIDSSVLTDAKNMPEDTLAQKIEKARIMHCHTRQQAMEAIGISNHTYMSVLKGRRQPCEKTMAKIIEYIK